MGFRPKIAVVSDDEVLRVLLCDLLSGEGLDVLPLQDARGLPEAALGRAPGLVIVDAILGVPESRALLDRLPAAFHGGPPPPVLLLVGSAAPPELREHRAVHAVVEAPFSSRTLVGAVGALVPVGRSQTRLRLATPGPRRP